MSERMAVFANLQQQLNVVVQQLGAGLDVAPAQRSRLEGFAAALIADGADVDAIEQICVAAGAGVVTVVRDGNSLRFDCRQQRAPVYPTTRD